MLFKEKTVFSQIYSWLKLIYVKQHFLIIQILNITELWTINPSLYPKYNS